MSQDVALDLAELVNHLVTEDDEPVDNLFSAKQQRLLARALYSSWRPLPSEESPDEPRPFIADANVGIFYATHRPPLVPDFFLSLDVQVAKDWYEKRHRSYFVWEFGKAPEVVVEIVSNREGHELGSKLKDYAQVGVTYYVVYDPLEQLSQDVLRIYELYLGKRYRLRKDRQLPDVGLQLTLWEGRFEAQAATWLRWCDAEGNLIPTGEERAKLEAERANRETDARQQAEAELARLKEELARREKQVPRKRGRKQ